MIKIMMTVCNRLAITKKSIEALERHSTIPYQLYVYDNLTNYKIDEHFDFWSSLYKQRKVTQVTFNTIDSTFNAFSKAVASNQFGLLHNQDPNRNNYDFLLMLDNDIIVTPKFDKVLMKVWKEIKEKKLDNIKLLSQSPGGIKYKQLIKGGLAGYDVTLGKLGGSGAWSCRPNFYQDVGFLDLKSMYGKVKGHDINYWRLCERATKGLPYIAGIKKKLYIHTGDVAGSICNTLSRNRDNPKVMEMIKFGKKDKEIDNMSFEEFYNMIINDEFLINDW